MEGANSTADRSDPERAAVASMEAAALRRAMWSLDDGQRVAIALVDIAGLSTAEAATAMGMVAAIGVLIVVYPVLRGRLVPQLVLGPRFRPTE